MTERSGVCAPYSSRLRSLAETTAPAPKVRQPVRRRRHEVIESNAFNTLKVIAGLSLYGDMLGSTAAFTAGMLHQRYRLSFQ